MFWTDFCALLWLPVCTLTNITPCLSLALVCAIFRSFKVNNFKSSTSPKKHVLPSLIECFEAVTRNKYLSKV